MKPRSRLVIVVIKRTSWKRLMQETSDPHVQDLLRQSSPSAARLRASHEAHEATVEEVWKSLQSLGLEGREVAPMPQPFSSEGAALVVTVGGDGTLLSASHHVSRGPILGINSAPNSSVGFFCGARGGEIEATLQAFLEGTLPSVTLTRMGVRCNGEQISHRVLNDALFCHASPAVTSRYTLTFQGHEEEQKSSGFWVGPAAGSTAAQHSAGGDILPLEAEELQFVVREPYTTAAPFALARGLVSPESTLQVRSRMHDARLFLDGPHEGRTVRLGDVVEFFRSDEPLTVLGMTRR